MILQHFLVTLILGVIFYIGIKNDDGSLKNTYIYLIGGISIILLVSYWIFYFLKFFIICI
jgi:hypothetical protein